MTCYTNIKKNKTIQNPSVSFFSSQKCIYFIQCCEQDGQCGLVTASSFCIIGLMSVSLKCCTVFLYVYNVNVWFRLDAQSCHFKGYKTIVFVVSAHSCHISPRGG